MKDRVMSEKEEKLERLIASRVREALIKDFNKLYVKKYTTAWKLERACRKIELDIMSLDNTIKAILKFLSKFELVQEVKFEALYRRKE